MHFRLRMVSQRLQERLDCLPLMLGKNYPLSEKISTRLLLKISTFYVALSSLVNLVKSRFAGLSLFYKASSDFINLFAFGVKNGVDGVQNRMERDCSDERNMV